MRLVHTWLTRSLLLWSVAQACVAGEPGQGAAYGDERVCRVRCNECAAEAAVLLLRDGEC